MWSGCRHSSLATFQRQVTADPPLGQPLTEAFSLTPARQPSRLLPDPLDRRAPSRASRHRSRINAKSIGSALAALLNPGFDYCQSAFNPLLQAAAGSGSPEVGEIVPLLVRSVPGSFRDESNSDVKSLVEVAIPIYAPGAATTTSAQRQAALLGWAAGLIDPDQATAPVLQGVSGLYITLSYDNPNGVTSTIDQAGQKQSHDMTRTVRLNTPGRWTAVIGLPAEAASPTVQALGLLDIGLILTVLLFLLLTRLARSRASALDMAEETSLELRHRSLHDQLTGLPNRDLIFDRADRMLARAKRDRVPVAAFFIDLDNFTAVNDSLGHTAGDHLLHAIAGRLQEAVRALGHTRAHRR